MSSTLIIEVSTSFTSPLILAMISPFLSWEKNPRGRDMILLYSWRRMSLTTPVLMGIMTADDPK